MDNLKGIQQLFDDLIARVIPGMIASAAFSFAANTKIGTLYVPEKAQQSQQDEATDLMQKSFAGRMMCVANGDSIDMKDVLKAFPMTLISLKDYTRSVVTAS